VEIKISHLKVAVACLQYLYMYTDNTCIEDSEYKNLIILSFWGWREGYSSFIGFPQAKKTVVTVQDAEDLK